MREVEKEFLKEARTSKGITQCEIASKVGISRAAYCNIEVGKRNPSVKLAKKIAKELNFDWTAFFDDK